MQLITYLINKGISGFLDKYQGLKKQITSIKNTIESSKSEHPYNDPINALHLKNLNILKKDTEELCEAKNITNIYEGFIQNYQEVLKELKYKQDYYADDKTFKLFTEKFYPPLLDSCMNYVYRFYIAVSENYTEKDDYLRFGFNETKDLMRIGRDILQITVESYEETPEGQQDREQEQEFIESTKNIENLENDD